MDSIVSTPKRSGVDTKVIREILCASLFTDSKYPSFNKRHLFLTFVIALLDLTMIFLPRSMPLRSSPLKPLTSVHDSGEQFFLRFEIFGKLLGICQIYYERGSGRPILLPISMFLQNPSDLSWSDIFYKIRICRICQLLRLSAPWTS